MTPAASLAVWITPHSGLRRGAVAAWLGLSIRCSVAAGQLGAEGDEFLVKSWQTDDGLPQNSIAAIVQSQEGYLWMGTFNGLVRFDGAKFTTYAAANTDGLLSDNINVLFEDQSRRLWIGTEGGGLIRFEHGVFTSLLALDPSGPALVTALSDDAQGTLWAGTPGGLYRLAGEQLERISPPRFQRRDDNVDALCADRGGSLWVNFGGELLRLHDSRWDPGPALNGDFQMCPDLTNGLWLAGRAIGLVHLAAGQATRLLDLSGQDVKQVRQMRDGEVWVATSRNGIIRFNHGRRLRMTTAEGLLINDTPVVSEDREGNVWIGSNGGGLQRLRRKVLRTITTRDGLPYNDVVCLLADRAGTAWIGTWGEGVRILKDGQFVRLAGLPAEGNAVVSLCAARDGAVWVGAAGGRLYRWRDGEVTRCEMISGEGARTIFEDREGGLWLGSRDEGAHRRQDGKITHFRPAEGLSDPYVTAIAQDADGAIWIGTKHGLNRIVGGVVQQYHRADGLGADTIHTLYADPNGALWIGTAGGGLTRFQRGRFATVTTRHGLANDVVAQILEDDRGCFWIGSNAGLLRVPRQDLEACLDGRANEIHGLVLSRSEGMLNPECAGSHQPACFKDGSGHLWFATVGGIVVVDPAKLVMNPMPPPVRVEQVRTEAGLIPAARDALLSSNQVIIPPGKDRIEIDFTALSYVAPERVRFRYRLVGWDSDWVEGGTQRAARYTKVAPGAYRFQVTACNNDGLWNYAGAMISLVVRPFWWQTATFQIVLGLALAGLGITAARAVHTRKLRRALERAEQKSALLRAAELGAANTELAARTQELESALASVKVLRGLIPICASCKKVRDDQGYWNQVEVYVMRHSEAQFSHSLCPECEKNFLNDLGELRK